MNAMRRFHPPFGCFAVLCSLLLLAASSVYAEEPDCAACHEDISKGKSIHQALSMGCTSCHSAVDASAVPHKITNKNPRGLSSKMRELCFSCHDKALFMKKTVHGAMALGCTSCHNPHVSANEHLLKEEIPKLCLNCHGDRLTAKKDKNHAPGKGEACSSCHNPHATDAPKLVASVRQATPGQ